jgi:hypothetical protein
VLESAICDTEELSTDPLLITILLNAPLNLLDGLASVVEAIDGSVSQDLATVSSKLSYW